MRSLSITNSSLENSLSKSDEEYFPTEAEQATLTPTTPISIPNSLSEVNFAGLCQEIDRCGVPEEAAARI